LEKSSFVEEKVFGLKIPEECQDVPKEILNPVQAWKNQNEYMAKAKELAKKFRENFQQFEKNCKPETLEAGPKI
jgi:phosphoenolpyruvate carboxykinase (ATP)